MRNAVTIYCPSESLADLLADALAQEGYDSIIRDGLTVVTHAPERVVNETCQALTWRAAS
jgi:hypothetical protein